jgi:WD40 repeat protein
MRTNSKKYHCLLGNYFIKLADPTGGQNWKGETVRPFIELTYQLQIIDIVKFENLLWDPRWLKAKLKHTNVHTIISDFEPLKTNRELSLVQSALYLSQYILIKDKSQLSSQLIGRLISLQNQKFEFLIHSIINSQEEIWLQPEMPVLKSPGGELIRNLEGHSEAVRAVAVNSAGSLAVSASEDHSLKVWDIISGRELHSLRGHLEAFQCYIYGVAIDSLGRIVVSSSADGTCKVWDLQSGKELRSIAANTGNYDRIALDSTGRLMLVASGYQTIRIWDTQNGMNLYTFKNEGNSHGVAMDSRGNLIVSTSNSNLKVWKVKSGKELFTLKGHSDYVNGVAVDAEGRIAVSASADCTCKVWCLHTGRELFSLKGHNGAVNDVAVDAKGHLAISGSDDRTVKIWNLDNGKELGTLKEHTGSVFGVAINSNGSLAISGSSDETVKVWDLKAINSIVSRAHNNVVTKIAVDSAGYFAITASWDRTIKVWNLHTFKEIYSLSGHSEEVSDLVIDPLGKLALTTSWDGTLKLWDLIDGKEIHSFNDTTAIYSIAVDGAFNIAITGGQDHFTIWNLRTSEKIFVLSANGGCESVAMDHSGHLAALIDQDKVCKIFDLSTRKWLFFLKGHKEDIECVFIDPNARFVVSGSSDNTIKIWNLKTGKELHSLKGHFKPITGVSLNLGCDLVVSSSYDKTIRVWSTQSGEEITRFFGDYPFNCSVITPDAKKIVAGDSNGGIHFLKLVFPKNIL